MKTTAAVSVLALCAASAAWAECDTVVMSDVGWTDITTTTATAKHVLEALGYEVDVKILSVPVTFASLESDDVDVFLGNWMPAQTGAIGPYLESGEIEAINVNLEGTKYTLAVPTYTYERGLQSYADIPEFAEQLEGKIYGIEPGNEGNGYLVSLIDENKMGWGDAELEVIESSEQGMLAQVERAYKDEQDIVFLGWEPHPMNANFSLKYLTGGEDFFGGEGVVHTVTRKGYSQECPNLGKLFANMDFTLEMENGIMGQILDDGADPADATLDWLKANAEVLDTWLAGVTAKDGGDAKAAVSAALGL
ncbi:choline ABC transporter substrate-binding protein [Vannielia litorea]|uniref:Glycine betaine/proline transport system substrate-binding protein n=1 Tax=Vannielia litorea TaxID=1217970 RepID=A0A1N6E5U2_9RHOB|nr:choline ABC transporter substrate-binding protein [Vannielia litorea]SIN78398.1 glycine betaine/proline transport system substrate-binding protein [Vannielia litorea]